MHAELAHEMQRYSLDDLYLLEASRASGMIYS